MINQLWRREKEKKRVIHLCLGGFWKGSATEVVSVEGWPACLTLYVDEETVVSFSSRRQQIKR